MRLILACALAVGAAVPAAAQPAADVPTQGRTNRPFAGTFGAMTARPGHADTFTVNGLWQGAYDDNVLAADAAGPIETGVQRSGTYSAAAAGANYQHDGRRFGVALDSSAAGRYYPDVREFTFMDSHVNARAAAKLGRTTLSLSGTAVYQPYYTLAAIPAAVDVTLPGDDPAPLPPSSVAMEPNPARHAQSYTLGSFVGVTRSLGARTDAELSVGYRRSEFTGGQGSDLATADVHGGIRHRLSAFTALRFGYGTSRALYGSSAETSARVDTYDIGLDYRRPLSFSRRTVVGFMTGVSRIEDGVTGVDYRGTGRAEMTHEIGRSWSVSVNYTRGAGFLPGLSRPVISDAVSVGSGGVIAKRLDVRLDAGYSNGHVGLTAAAPPLEAESGLVRLRYSLARELALFGEYSYYHYALGAAEALRQGLPPQMDRRGIRAGVQFFVPFIH